MWMEIIQQISEIICFLLQDLISNETSFLCKSITITSIFFKKVHFSFLFWYQNGSSNKKEKEAEHLYKPKLNIRIDLNHEDTKLIIIIIIINSIVI